MCPWAVARTVPDAAAACVYVFLCGCSFQFHAPTPGTARSVGATGTTTDRALQMIYSDVVGKESDSASRMGAFGECGLCWRWSRVPTQHEHVADDHKTQSSPRGLNVPTPPPAPMTERDVFGRLLTRRGVCEEGQLEEYLSLSFDKVVSSDTGLDFQEFVEALRHVAEHKYREDAEDAGELAVDDPTQVCRLCFRASHHVCFFFLAGYPFAHLLFEHILDQQPKVCAHACVRVVPTSATPQPSLA